MVQEKLSAIACLNRLTCYNDFPRIIEEAKVVVNNYRDGSDDEIIEFCKESWNLFESFYTSDISSVGGDESKFFGIMENRHTSLAMVWASLKKIHPEVMERAMLLCPQASLYRENIYHSRWMSYFTNRIKLYER